MDQQYLWFKLRIATTSAKHMHNCVFPKPSHLKSPHFSGNSISLAAPRFLCREALQLALCSRQGWDSQGCPKIIRDAEGQWLNFSSSLPITLTSLSAISRSWSWGGTLQTTMHGQALRLFQLSVVCPIKRGHWKRFLNMTMKEKVLSNYQQG